MAHRKGMEPCWAEGLDVFRACGGLLRLSDRFNKSNPSECIFHDMLMGHFSEKPVRHQRMFRRELRTWIKTNGRGRAVTSELPVAFPSISCSTVWSLLRRISARN